MKKVLLSSLLAVMLSLTSISAFAQLPTESNDVYWNRVNSLVKEEKVLIELKNGKTIKTKINSVSDNGIVIDQKGKTKDIAKNDIGKIYQLTKKRPTKGVLIGAGSGFAVGAGTMAAIGGDDGDAAAAAFVLGGGAIGAGVGALVGWLAGKGDKKELFYENK